MNKLLFIIQREFNQRVRKRSFIITTVLTPLLMLAIFTIPALMAVYSAKSGSGETTREIVVIDPDSLVSPSLTAGQGLTFVPTTLQADSAMASADYAGAYGFLVVGSDVVDNPSALNLYTREATTMDVERNIRNQAAAAIRNHRLARIDIPGIDSIANTLNVYPQVSVFRLNAATADSAVADSSAASMGISYALGFIVYMFIFIYGAAIMQGVIEEKNNRIVEVIVSSVRPFQLMMGKIIGLALVAMLQFLIWVVLIGVGISIVGNYVDISGSMAFMQSDYLIGIAGWFMLFFIGGYLLYASMFAAVGSAVENISDTQQLQLPITIPLILSIIMMMQIIQAPHSDLAFWFSIIPFTSPIVMLARIPFGVPVWEILLALVLLYATFLFMVSMAAKIYRIGIFMYGKKPSWSELIRWIRYKG